MWTRAVAIGALASMEVAADQPPPALAVMAAVAADQGLELQAVMAAVAARPRLVQGVLAGGEAAEGRVQQPAEQGAGDSPISNSSRTWGFEHADH